jgi:PAS domain S-box-containing protein
MFGRRPEDLVDKPIWTEFPEGKGQPFHHAYQRALAEQTPIRLEAFYEPWGRWYENRIYPSPDGLSIYFSDVTERREAEARLRVSEERFATAFRASPVAMSISTLAEGRIVDANESFVQLSGYSREELIGRTADELGLWADPEERARVVAGLVEGGTLRDLDVRVRRKGGEIRHVLGSMERISLGDQPCLLTLAVDVTARRQAEAERDRLFALERTAREKAERQRRETDVLAELVAGVSASLDLDTVLRRVAEGARELCSSDVARVALRDPASGALAFRYWTGPRRDWYATFRMEPGKGFGGLVLATGKPVRTDDCLADPRISKDYHWVALEEGAVAALAVPIGPPGDVQGALFVVNYAHRPFTERDETVLARLAEHASVAIRNAQLFASEQAEIVERRRAEEALREAHADLARRVEE